MIPFGFTPFLCHFPTIPQLLFFIHSIIPSPLPSFLLLYRIHDNQSIVVNGKLKYLLIICIGGIFTSVN
nr:MAG TPA: hypothetical protein [Caudoviricetes sp.]